MTGTQDAHRLASELTGRSDIPRWLKVAPAATLAPALTDYAETGWTAGDLVTVLRSVAREVGPLAGSPAERLAALLARVPVHGRRRPADVHAVARDRAAQVRRAELERDRDDRATQQRAAGVTPWMAVCRRIARQVDDNARARKTGGEVQRPDWREVADQVAAEVGADPAGGQLLYGDWLR